MTIKWLFPFFPQRVHEEVINRGDRGWGWKWDSETKQTLSSFASLANVTKFIDGIIGKLGFEPSVVFWMRGRGWRSHKMLTAPHGSSGPPAPCSCVTSIIAASSPTKGWGFSSRLPGMNNKRWPPLLPTALDCVINIYNMGLKVVPKLQKLHFPD